MQPSTSTARAEPGQPAYRVSQMPAPCKTKHPLGKGLSEAEVLRSHTAFGFQKSFYRNRHKKPIIFAFFVFRDSVGQNSNFLP